MNPILQLLFQKTLVFIHHYLENESFRQYMLSGGQFEGEYLGNYVSVPAYFNPEYTIIQFNPEQIFNLFKVFAANPKAYRELQRAAYLDYELTEQDLDELRQMESIPHGRADVISSMTNSFLKRKPIKSLQKQAQEKKDLEQRYNEFEQKWKERIQKIGSKVISYRDFIKEESFRTGKPLPTPPPPEPSYWQEYRKQMGEELGAEEKWEKEWQKKYNPSRLQKLNERKKKAIRFLSNAQALWSFNPLNWLWQKFTKWFGNLARTALSQVWGFIQKFIPQNFLQILSRIGRIFNTVAKPFQILWRILTFDPLKFIGNLFFTLWRSVLSQVWGFIQPYILGGLKAVASFAIRAVATVFSFTFQAIPIIAQVAMRALPIFIGGISWGAAAIVAGIVGILGGLFWLLQYTSDPTIRPPETNPASAAALQGAGCPTQVQIDQNKQSPETCTFLNPSIPIFYTDLDPNTITIYIEKYSKVFIDKGVGDKDEFRRRVNHIISKSKEAGINPVLLLAYWRTESAFSTSPDASDLGCAPRSPSMQGFERQVECALGLISGGNRGSMCARSSIEPVTEKQKAEVKTLKAACEELKGIRTSTSIQPGYNISNAEIYRNYLIAYPIKTFDHFAEGYGSLSPLLLSIKEKQEGKKNNNCIHTYNILIEMAEEMNACIPLAQQPGTPIITAHPTVNNAGPVIADQAIVLASQLYDINDTAGLQKAGIVCEDRREPANRNPSYKSFHCWKGMATHNFIANDENYFQCTEFVDLVYERTGFAKEIGLLSANNDAGNWPIAAKDYARGNQKGNPEIFEVFYDATQLNKGDIISLAGPAGPDPSKDPAADSTKTIPSGKSQNSHLAIVTKVDPGNSNVIEVAQANTSAPFEKWVINEQTKQIEWKITEVGNQALRDAHPQSRVYNRGFIRIVGKLR